MDYSTILPWVLALIFGSDKLLAALERLGLLPRRLQGWDRQRARRIVEMEARNEALTRLALKADEILAWLRPNGGKSIGDRVDRLALNLQAHILDSVADAALLRNHIAETAPLILEFEEIKGRLISRDLADET